MKDFHAVLAESDACIAEARAALAAQGFLPHHDARLTGQLCREARRCVADEKALRRIVDRLCPVGSVVDVAVQQGTSTEVFPATVAAYMEPLHSGLAVRFDRLRAPRLEWVSDSGLVPIEWTHVRLAARK